MEEGRLVEWLEGYRRAWETRDPDAAAALFSERAEYRETPFSPPHLGRDGVRRYWREATGSQRDISFRYRILSIRADGGIAHWTARFTRVPSGERVLLDGIFVLDFDDEGQCQGLREWWHYLSPQEGES